WPQGGRRGHRGVDGREWDSKAGLGQPDGRLEREGAGNSVTRLRLELGVQEPGTRSMTCSRIGVVTVLIAVVLGDAGRAQETRGADRKGQGKKATALVEVTTPGPEGGGSGSAFCIDRSGLFLTNAHVIEEAEGGRAEVRLVLDPGGSAKRLILRARIV